MVSVERERYVKHMGHDGIRLLAGEAIEEVGGKAESRIGIESILTSAETSKRTDDGGGLRHQLGGLALIRFGRHVLRFRVRQAEHGDCGAQNIHGRGCQVGLEEVGDLGWQGVGGVQPVCQGSQFGLGWKSTFPKKPYGLFKSGVLRQGVDVVTPVAEDALIAVYVTNL